MSFSILIPTLNEEKYIGILLDALVQQTYRDFEVILVDADSADRTRDVAERFTSQLDLRIYSVRERGRIGMQRNLAARKARADDLVFFDADVKPAPDFLERLNASVEIRQLDCATCWNEPMTSRLSYKAVFFVINAGFLSPMQHLSPGAIGTFIYVRKAVFDAVGGFDESVVFAEDFDLTQRLANAGYRFGLIKNLRIPFSVRRLDKDGRLRYIWKMLRAAAYIGLVGNIRQPGLVNHRFGEFG